MSGKSKSKKGHQKKRSPATSESSSSTNAGNPPPPAPANEPPMEAMKNLTVTDQDQHPQPIVSNSSNPESVPLNNGHVSGVGDNAHIDDSSADDPSSEQAAADKRNKEKKHDAGAADLERVTDYAEETEINESDISGVMGLIGQEVAGRLERERLISKKILVKKEDIDILANEFEISRERAELVLREHEGNLKRALYTLTE